MDAREAADPSRCPLCGGPNRCALARPGGAGPAPCWCVARRFPAALLARAPGGACVCAACLGRAQSGSGTLAAMGTEADNEATIRRFLEAWSRLDPAELAGFFAEDGVYHNIPAAPIAGRTKIGEFIRGFTASWTETEWEILTLVASGDVVVAERVDRTRAGEKSVDLPCVGVFELEGGEIKVWRDYFDLGTYQRGLG